MRGERTWVSQEEPAGFLPPGIWDCFRAKLKLFSAVSSHIQPIHLKRVRSKRYKHPQTTLYTCDKKMGGFLFVRNVHLKGVSLRHGGSLSESMCVGSMQLASLLLSLPPCCPNAAHRGPTETHGRRPSLDWYRVCLVHTRWGRG